MLSYAVAAILSRDKSEKPGRMQARASAGARRNRETAGRSGLAEASVDGPCGGRHLYSVHEFGHSAAGGAAAILGLRRVSSFAGKHCEEFACWAGHLRGDADGWREIALLSVAGRDFAAENGHCGVAADRVNAGP